MSDAAAVEAAARAHVERVLARDPAAHQDLAPSVQLIPGDLLEQLAQSGPTRADLVAHARIGAHHILKTRFVGASVHVVQARWAADASGRWRILDAELLPGGPSR